MKADDQRWEDLLWTGRGQGSFFSRLVRTPFTVLSWLYGAGVACRVFAYNHGIFKPRQVSAKVIVVGNLTVGGSGKTPLAGWIARKLKELGLEVALITHGYKAKGGSEPRVASEGQGLILPLELVGDEAALLASRVRGVPIVVGRDRVASCELAIAKFSATHLVLDDGFQHLRLHRDVDLLILDTQRDPAQEYLLPRGPLREPITAASRAQALIFSSPEENPLPPWPWLDRFCPQLPRFLMRLKPQGLVSFLGDGIRPLARSSLVFAGISRPQRFFDSFVAAGGRIAKKVVFRDHHEYQAQDLERLITQAKQAGAERLVTTEKDAVKIRPEWTQGFPLEVFRVEPDFLGQEQSLLALILEYCGDKGNAA